MKTPWVQPGKAEETHPLSPHHPLRCATTACTRLLSLGCVLTPTPINGLSLWFRLCKPPLLGDYIELEA